MADITPVAPMDSSQKNSPITIPSHEESTVMMNVANKTCTWNGEDFTDGARVCDSGTVYECSFGKWVKTGSSC